MDKKIKSFCEKTRAKEVEVCQDTEGGLDIKIANGKRRTRLCARVRCPNSD